jgi:hypothetical protein
MVFQQRRGSVPASTADNAVPGNCAHRAPCQACSYSASKRASRSHETASTLKPPDERSSMACWCCRDRGVCGGRARARARRRRAPCWGGSSIGRTADADSANLGSNPGPPASASCPVADPFKPLGNQSSSVGVAFTAANKLRSSNKKGGRAGFEPAARLVRRRAPRSHIQARAP